MNILPVGKISVDQLSFAIASSSLSSANQRPRFDFVAECQFVQCAIDELVAAWIAELARKFNALVGNDFQRHIILRNHFIHPKPKYCKLYQVYGV